ncbi:DNA-binding FadR family transcriptional regulator [Arthrobacter sp. PvP102]|uniref:FadR/GntR family transcriptional regulator n=1 Tax=unclassified Arthrobacter TaxID=235627 RepID=UPI001AE4E693|nr:MULTISPECIES: FCD domain-containing protein [unclassified Arthrobacter]MBP1233287.1 DNA-binding FadR family transcriptional regulator [Arthrobacter sp. PvP103]MBP1238422.1 DNA-binding FadR family transcriptional regulator [Arthrobacter sp. PvP102]
MSAHSPDVDTAVHVGTIDMIAQLRGVDASGSGLSDRISRQLESAIAVGLLNDGDKLPPENVLAEQLGVSSITLRQSLAEMRLKGLVETRRGRGGGSFISGKALATPEQLLSEFRRRSPEDLRDLGDLAATVAAGVGRRAALRADEQDLRRCRELAHRFARASTAEELRRTDSRFHISLGVAAQSRRLTNATIQVHSELAALMWIAGASAGSIKTASEEHDAILDAIERRDEEAADRLSAAHFERESETLLDFFLELATTTPEEA